MSHHNHDNKHGNPTPKQEVTISGKVLTEFDPHSFDKIVDAIGKKNDKEEQKDKHDKTIGEKQVDEQINANTISRRSLYASCAVFAITAAIFVWNILAVNAAKEAASAAKDAVVQYQLANGIADSNYKLAKESFERQIMPILYRDTITSSSFKINSNYTVTIRVKNFGKSLAKIYYYKAKIYYGDIEKDNFFRFLPSDIHAKDMLLETYKTFDVPVGDFMDLGHHNFVYVDNNLFYYAFGEIVYSDLLNTKTYAYQFCYGIDSNGNLFPAKKHNGVIETKVIDPYETFELLRPIEKK